ncbi:hypothetical protein Drorol1_Dr00021714 [Drosera rotundifolia]
MGKERKSKKKACHSKKEATRLTTCLDQLEKEFTKPSQEKIRQRSRNKGKKDAKENQKVDFGNVDDGAKDERQKNQDEGWNEKYKDFDFGITDDHENESGKEVENEGEKKTEVEGEKKFADEDEIG